MFFYHSGNGGDCDRGLSLLNIKKPYKGGLRLVYYLINRVYEPIYLSEQLCWLFEALERARDPEFPGQQ